MSLLSACGIPKEDYDQLAKQNEELTKELEDYKEDIEELKNKVYLKQADSITSAEMLKKIEENLVSDEELALKYMAVFSNEFTSSKENERVREIYDELLQ